MCEDYIHNYGTLIFYTNWYILLFEAIGFIFKGCPCFNSWKIMGYEKGSNDNDFFAKWDFSKGECIYLEHTPFFILQVTVIVHFFFHLLSWSMFLSVTYFLFYCEVCATFTIPRWGHYRLHKNDSNGKIPHKKSVIILTFTNEAG